jgi:hypothetical protein
MGPAIVRHSGFRAPPAQPDPTVHPGLAAGGIQEHVGERLVGRAPVAERTDLGVEVGRRD